MTRLGDICKFQSGGTPSKSNPEYFGGDIPWITTVALNGSEIGQQNAVDMITEKAIQESAAKIVPANSIMVGTRVGVGKVAINSVPMCTSQDVISLVDIDERVWDKRYLRCLIQRQKEYLVSQARGATIKGIKIDVLADLVVPELEIEQQRKVAERLQIVDLVLNCRKQQLAKLDELVKARFVEMIRENDPKYIKLKDVVEEDRIITYGIVKPGEHTEGGIPIIKVKDFPNGAVLMHDMLLASPEIESKYKRSRVREGDLLFSIRGSVGRTAFVPKELTDANITQDTARLSISRDFAPKYVRAALEYDAVQYEINQYIRGVAVRGINLADLREIEIPVVDSYLQEQFADFVEQTDKSKLAVQQSLEKLELMKKTLMQEYFG